MSGQTKINTSLITGLDLDALEAEWHRRTVPRGFAQLIAIARAAKDVASYGTDTQGWRLERWLNWEADVRKLQALVCTDANGLNEKTTPA